MNSTPRAGSRCLMAVDPPAVTRWQESGGTWNVLPVSNAQDDLSILTIRTSWGNRSLIHPAPAMRVGRSAPQETDHPMIATEPDSLGRRAPERSSLVESSWRGWC